MMKKLVLMAASGESVVNGTESATACVEVSTRGENTAGLISTSKFTRKAGGLNLQFVGNVPEDLICGICTMVS